MIRIENFNGSVWTFDTEKSTRGPISVEINKEGCAMDVEDALPKSAKTFWNPATLSFVSYATARQLGLNTDEEPAVYLPGFEHNLYRK